MQISTVVVESSMETPQKIKNGTAFWSCDPTSENISKGTQDTNAKELMHPYVHCSIIYSHQYMEAAQVSINRWVHKTTTELKNKLKVTRGEKEMEENRGRSIKEHV